jgi:hypothetical protein
VSHRHENFQEIPRKSIAAYRSRQVVSSHRPRIHGPDNAGARLTEEVTAVNITIDRYRQHADLCMSVSLRASVTTPVVVEGASVAGIVPAAGQKSAVLTGAFAGTSAWSPPI